MIPRYKLRYFFELGGDCLWAANDAAMEKFGYPVFLDDLPLTDATRQCGAALLERSVMLFDTNGGHVDQSFMIDARIFLERLRSELGPAFEIVDEL
jgi:hypothetical protein